MGFSSRFGFCLLTSTLLLCLFFLVITLNIFVNKIVVLYVLCVIVKKLLSLRWKLRTWILGEKKTDSGNLFYSQLETEHPGN